MGSVVRRGRYLGLVAACLAAAAGCAYLGTWQWDRYSDKHETNRTLRDNAARAPEPVDEVLAPGRPFSRDGRLRRVTASGHYDVSGQVYVRNRQVDDQVGLLVVTPLRTDGGAVLLVVRGWTPAAARADQTPPVPDPPAGEVRLTGRAYPSESGGTGTGLPDRQVSRIDVPALAGRLDAPTYGGYVELVEQAPARPDAAALRPLPDPNLSNPAGGAGEPQHLAYVAQWFVFAALALVAPWLLIWLDLRRAPTPDAPDTSDASDTPDTSRDPGTPGDPGDPGTPGGAGGAGGVSPVRPAPSATRTGRAPLPGSSPR